MDSVVPTLPTMTLLLTEGFIPWLVNLQLFANILVDLVQVTARGVCRLVL